MGGSQSKAAEILRYVDKEWQFISQEHGINILRNKETDNEAEVHKVYLQARRDIDKELQIYNYRRTQDNALVAVYSVQNFKETQQTVCGNDQAFQVLTERIPFRIKDLNQLNFKESLYTLSESLRGFDDLYSKVGDFQVNDQMIGVNTRGNVKVWLNQNFAQNHQSNERPMLQVTAANSYRQNTEKAEEKMVHNVVSVLQKKCQSGQYPEQFRNGIYSTTNFIDAYHLIEQFCQDNKLEIPDRLQINGYSNVSKQSALNNNSLGYIQTTNSRFTPIKPNQISNQNIVLSPRETIAKNLSNSHFSNNFNNKPFHQSINTQQVRSSFNSPYRLTNIVQSSDRTVNSYPVIQQPSFTGFTQPLSPRRMNPPSQIKFNYGNTNNSFSFKRF